MHANLTKMSVSIIYHYQQISVGLAKDLSARANLSVVHLGKDTDT